MRVARLRPEVSIHASTKNSHPSPTPRGIPLAELCGRWPVLAWPRRVADALFQPRCATRFGRGTGAENRSPDANTTLGFSLPEDSCDLVDLSKKIIGDSRIEGALSAASPGEFRRLVEQLVQLRVLLEVRGLEVVGPQHP